MNYTLQNEPALTNINAFLGVLPSSIAPDKDPTNGYKRWRVQNIQNISDYSFGYTQEYKSGDFDTRQKGKRETRKTAKKFEDVESWASLDEDDSQTRKQLAEQLGVVDKLFPIDHKK